jgi:hypothetical protein
MNLLTPVDVAGDSSLVSRPMSGQGTDLAAPRTAIGFGFALEENLADEGNNTITEEIILSLSGALATCFPQGALGPRLVTM